MEFTEPQRFQAIQVLMTERAAYKIRNELDEVR